MSISSFLGMETALRGLLAQQRALDVTTHNVSNASTAGYSRQEAVLSASAPLELPAGVLSTGGAAMLGQGVDVASFQRIRDAFADLQYRAQNMGLGDHDATAQTLDQVQSVLAEPSDDGIGQVLAKFWSAWDDLSNNPENPATRQAVVTQGSLLADRLQELDSQLGGIQAQAQNQYAQEVGPNGDVLAAANEIAQLNGAIKAATGSGATPNDLLDRRDQALDTLSKLGQVSVTDLGNGAISVQFGDAASPLVNDGNVTWPQTLTAPGGELGALLKLGDPTSGTIAGYRSDLDSMTSGLITAVNGAYQGTFFAGNSASTISVAATSATLTASSTGATGANELALAVANLRGGASDTAYSALVAKIGGDARQAEQQAKTSEALVARADDRRSSVSGVSMDEELANMVRFQRGYQASARMMSTMDEMLDTLINRTGKVGL